MLVRNPFEEFTICHSAFVRKSDSLAKYVIITLQGGFLQTLPLLRITALPIPATIVTKLATVVFSFGG